jgi:GntR family transcriptional regulator/MocR family aminotransferase
MRRAADVHPPALDQVVLADFISGGHYERHLRRMRAAYRERLEALSAGLDRHCGGALTLRTVRTGLHAVADVDRADAVEVVRECALRGVEVTPLSSYYLGRDKTANSIVMGFASVRTDAILAGTGRMAEAIEAARRRTVRTALRARRP